ncbi:MAG: hypothetical protein K2X87_24055 [Gemmataceae bacterium]|nr:hypothetical protein [Gemmataceae bacterium]
MPRFEDYNRTVIGYHGTRASVARRMVLGEQAFEFSRNDDDWLGHGIYFWEHAPQQAWRWAKQRGKRQGWGEEPAVVASMIRLGNCFDLLDPYNVRELTAFQDQLRENLELAGEAVPVNVKARKSLDCAVFEFAYREVEAGGRAVDTVRAVFVPSGSGQRAWPSSGIHRSAHVQLCVRNPRCILGTWLVRPTDDLEVG